MDKNTLIGFLLIGVVLFAFSWFNRPTPEQLEAQRRYQDSIAKIEYAQQLELQKQENKSALVEDSLENLPDSVRAQRLQQSFGVFGEAMVGTEDYTTLQNDVVELRISNKGGRICYARLKEYDTYNDEPLVLFDEKESNFNFTLVTATNRVVNTGDLYFTPVKGNDPNSVIMRLNTGEGSHLDFTYTLKPDDYMVQYQILGTGLNGVLAPSTNALDLLWEQDIRQQEKGRKFEDRYVTLNYKFMADDVEHLSESKSDSKQIPNRLKWIGYKDMFFSTVLISQEGFEATTLDSKAIPEGDVLKQFKTTTSVPFDLQGKEATNLSLYFGPNKFALLKSFDKGVVAEQQLDHRHSTDVLRTHGVLRPAQRVQEGGCAIRCAGGGQHFTHFQEVGFWRTTDVFNNVRRVAGNVRFQQVPHTARMSQCFIAFRIAVFIELIVPGRFVVLAFFSVITAEQAIFESKIITHQQAGVGVMLNVFGIDFVVFDQVAQNARQERNVRTGTNRCVNIRYRSGTRKARIDHNQLRAVVNFGFHRPAEPDRVSFSGVTAHHHDEVGVLDVDPVVGHRTATKCWSKTCYRWSVSDTRLVVDREHTQRAGEFLR